MSDAGSFGDEGAGLRPGRDLFRSSEPQTRAQAPRKRKPSSTLRVSAVVVVAAVAAFAAWLVVRNPTTKTIATPPSSPGVVRVTALDLTSAGLTTLAGHLSRPIYWQGPAAGVSYGLTLDPDGRSYVRYLPKGVAVGSPTAYPTVATYPFTGAYAATEAVAAKKSSVRVPVGHGAVAFYTRGRPTNVYLALPNSSYQIEVFNPSARKALAAVEHGSIAPVVQTSSGSAPATQATAVATSPSALKALAVAVGHPIYWAGQLRGLKEELTQTPDGRIYIRYLPANVAVGAPQPYLTIATYPLTGAFATTTAAAHQSDVVPVKVSGGVGFYLKKHPTSVYIAFPNIAEQIEVFDPTPNRAKRLVSTAQIRAVP